MAEQKEKQAKRGDAPAKKGIMGSMLERAEQERQRREAAGGAKGASKGDAKGSGPRPGSAKPKGGGSGTPRKSTKGLPPGGSKGSKPPRGTKKPGSGSGGQG